MSMKAGDQLCDGRYGLIKRVGKNASTNIWLAVNNDDHEKVLLCVLHKHIASDPARRRLVLDAARKMAKLEHPGILWILEPRLEEGGEHFYVKEFVEGESMHDAVLGGRLDRRASLALISRVGNALGYAHARGMVHRDVNPTNILIDPSGSPRLTDLYLSSSRGRTATSAEIATDVYTLAMTTLFGLHGDDLPMLEVMRDAASFIDRLECEDYIKAVLKHATQFDKSKRYQNTKSFCDDLDAAAAGRKPAILASSVASATPPTKPPRPHLSLVPPPPDKDEDTTAKPAEPAEPAESAEPTETTEPAESAATASVSDSVTELDPVEFEPIAEPVAAPIEPLLPTPPPPTPTTPTPTTSVAPPDEPRASEDTIEAKRDDDEKRGGALPLIIGVVVVLLLAGGAWALFGSQKADAPEDGALVANAKTTASDSKTADEKHEASGQDADGQGAGQDADGQGSAGQDADGQDSAGQDADGQGSAGQDADGQDSAGQDADGQDSAGQDADGQDSAGEEASEPPDTKTPKPEPKAAAPQPERKRTLAATMKYMEKRVRSKCTKLVSGPTKVSVELTLRGDEGRVKAKALGSHAVTSLGKCVVNTINRSNFKPYKPGPEPVLKRDLAFE